LKNPITKKKKKWAGGMAQGEGPEFKPQYCKKQNKTKSKQELDKSMSNKLFAKFNINIFRQWQCNSSVACCFLWVLASPLHSSLIIFCLYITFRYDFMCLAYSY
jgi:hypothetical protein